LTDGGKFPQGHCGSPGVSKASEGKAQLGAELWGGSVLCKATNGRQVWCKMCEGESPAVRKYRLEALGGGLEPCICKLLGYLCPVGKP
jgi:hypothetical protein